MNLFRSFSADDLRLNLKLAEARIEILLNKKKKDIDRQKREIAVLLGDNKEEFARIRTEHVVMDDSHYEVLQIVALHCALLKERVKLMESSPSIPYDMKECCTTLVYAADRVGDVPELGKVKSQLMLKYKKELTAWLATEEKARENVNERIFKRLSPQPPNAFIVTEYMRTIAEEAGVSWAPTQEFAQVRLDQPAPAPTGASIVPGSASGIKAPYLVTDGTLSRTGLSSASSSGPAGSSADLIPPLSSAKPRGGGGGGGGGPALGSATIAAATASRRRSEDGATPPPSLGSAKPVANVAKPAAPEFVVLGGDKELYPAAVPVTSNAGAAPDFDELQARFEALKRG